MYYSIRTIVVGVGELDEADPILSAAVALAQRTGAALHAVHAYEIPALIWDAYLAAGVESGGIQEDIAYAHAEALANAARRVAQGTGIHCHIVRGTPEYAVNEITRKVGADLVVIGATHHRAFARRVLGTAAQRVLRHATAPVLVVRRALPARFERVLLTTDLGELSASVHEVGLDVLDALSDGEPPEVASLVTVPLPLGLTPRLSTGELGHTASVRLRKFLRARRPRTGKIRGRVRFGIPTIEILQEAAEWDPDLVILGTHSHTGLDRFWLGSVAEAVLRDLRCSALVVPVAAVDRLHLPVRVSQGAVAARVE
jgi:nucleotide-binding universal stress UspA family protein